MRAEGLWLSLQADAVSSLGGRWARLGSALAGGVPLTSGLATGAFSVTVISPAS